VLDRPISAWAVEFQAGAGLRCRFCSIYPDPLSTVGKLPGDRFELVNDCCWSDIRTKRTDSEPKKQKTVSAENRTD